MTTDTVKATFRDLLLATLDDKPGLSEKLGPEKFRRNERGAVFALPTEKFAIIGTDNTGGRVSLPENVDFLTGDSEDSPILARLRLITTAETRGKLGGVGTLPSSTMQSEHSTAAAFSDFALGDNEFVLDSVVEVKGEVSLQVVLQSGPQAVDELVLESHRQAVADKVLSQLLIGTGLGNEVVGVTKHTGLAAAVEYTAADKGKSSTFATAEQVVEDAGARPSGLAWALGHALSSSARSTLVEPGADRRVEERARITLSGTPVQRFPAGSIFPENLGLLADWNRVVLIVADEVEIVVDRITKPGMLKLTTRLAISDPIVPVTGMIGRIAQA